MSEMTAIEALDYLRGLVVGPHRGAERAYAVLRRFVEVLERAEKAEERVAQLVARIRHIDSVALAALSKAGVATPAEGFDAVGWTWLDHAIGELSKATNKPSKLATEGPYRGFYTTEPDESGRYWLALRSSDLKSIVSDQPSVHAHNLCQTALDARLSGPDSPVTREDITAVLGDPTPKERADGVPYMATETGESDQ